MSQLNRNAHRDEMMKIIFVIYRHAHNGEI